MILCQQKEYLHPDFGQETRYNFGGQTPAVGKVKKWHPVTQSSKHAAVFSFNQK